MTSVLKYILLDSLTLYLAFTKFNLSAIFLIFRCVFFHLTDCFHFQLCHVKIFLSNHQLTVESGNIQKIYFLYFPPNNLLIRIVYSDLKAYRAVWESREIRIVNSRCATCERTRVTRNVPRCRWRIGRVSSFSKIAGALLWNARSDAEKKWKDDAIGAGGFTKQVKKEGICEADGHCSVKNGSAMKAACWNILRRLFCYFFTERLMSVKCACRWPFPFFIIITFSLKSGEMCFTGFYQRIRYAWLLCEMKI